MNLGAALRTSCILLLKEADFLFIKIQNVTKLLKGVVSGDKEDVEDIFSEFNSSQR